MRTKHDLIIDSVWDSRARYLLEQDDKPWYIPERTRKVLIDRANNTCVICGRKFSFTYLHIDHRTPVSLGGKATFDNLQVLCQWCNLSKSNHLLDPRSYRDGYVIPIIPLTDKIVSEEILRRVESELY